MSPSSAILRVLKENPVDEMSVAEEKFLEMLSSTSQKQAEYFTQHWIFMLGVEGARTVLKIKEDFELALVNHWTNGALTTDFSNFNATAITEAARKFSVTSKGSEYDITDLLEKNYLPLSSTSFTAFLEKRGKPMAQLHRKTGFIGVYNENTGLTLLGYLLYHFRRKILIHYFKRRGKAVVKEVVGLQCGKQLGNGQVGFELNLQGGRKTVAEALKEETFLKLPLGVDDLLDEGLSQFEEYILPVRRAICELTIIAENENQSIVKRNAAKSELASVHSQYAEAHQTSFNRMKPRIDKLAKLRKQKYLEIMGQVRKKIKYRNMTLVKHSA